jgi:ABC-type hemin transport system substrate-binding protein
VSNPVFTLTAKVLPLRIVCLVPSITELIVDLGLAGHLVGRTGFCIHPAHAVQAIPKVGGTKAVNLQKIRALAPTHVVVNVDENDKTTVDALRPWVPHILVTHPQSPADNLALIDQLVDAFKDCALTLSPVDRARQPHLQGMPDATNSGAAYALFERAGWLKDQFSLRLQALQARRSQRTPERVLYLIWQDPWMTVARDTYISRMLALIGWQTWPAVQGGDGIHTPGAARYPVLAGDEPWLGGVQRVLLSSEPYSFGVQHVAQVQSWLPQATVQLVDGEMLSWYGSRALPGLDYLAALSGAAANGSPGVANASPL